MNGIEDRLRDAYYGAAQTIQPGTTRPWPGPGGQPAVPGRGPRRRRAAPLLAAAAVIVIAAAAVVVPRLVSGSARPPSGGVAQGYSQGRLPSGGPPAFVVTVNYAAGRSRFSTSLDVLRTATGRATGHLAPPAPGRYFQVVTALGGGRTYLAAATSLSACRTWLYEFRLTAAGRPTGLTPFRVPSVPGRPAGNYPLASSADGSMVAYSTAKCTLPQGTGHYGVVGVLGTRTAMNRVWRFRPPAGPISLSLSADGRLLELVTQTDRPSRVSAYFLETAWVVRTRSPSGELARHYRQVFPVPPNNDYQWGPALLSPTGAVTIAIWYHLNHGVLSAYQTATGRRIEVLYVFPHQRITYDPPGLAGVASSRYLLVYFWNKHLGLFNLATRRMTKVPGQTGLPRSAAW